MNRQRQITILAVVFLYIAACPVLTFFRNGTESYTFHLAHSILSAAIILAINDWKIPFQSHISFFSSLMFVFGAMYLGIKSYNLWFHITGTAEPMPISVNDGKPAAYALQYLKGNIDLIIVAPIIEEIIFRRGLMDTLAKLINKPSALIIASIIFTESHFANTPQWFMPSIFITAICMGLAYFLLGLPWAIVLHSLYNGQFVIGEFLSKNETASIAATLIALIGSWFFISRIFRFRKIIFGG